MRRLKLHQLQNTMSKWAASWQNQQSECAPNEDSDQPRHPPSLITAFAVRSWVAKDPRFHHADSKDSEQTGLCLRWAHTHFVGCVVLRLKSTWTIITTYLICWTYIIHDTGHINICVSWDYDIFVVVSLGCVWKSLPDHNFGVSTPYWNK